MHVRPPRWAFGLIAFALSACGALEVTVDQGVNGDRGVDGDRGVAPAPDLGGATVDDSAFQTETSTARFLTQSTFGVTEADLDALTGRSASGWVLQQMAEEPTLLQPRLRANIDARVFREGTVGTMWLVNAIEGDDQLRQRVAFALSQIVVVSDIPDQIADATLGMSYYQDILIRNAFGSYRTILEEVTYAPVMAEYLTFLENQRADPESGRQPDENYAREILQLFSIGTVELNPDGTPRLGPDGQPIETYTNADISGLARVFTGLVENYDAIPDELFDEEPFLATNLSSALPLIANPEIHELGEKRFLGLTIPAGTEVEDSIEMALDHIMAHPNVGPFLGRQLIQRLVTSNPSPAYVRRVAAAFDDGTYVLPNGTTVGSEARGDLGATVAAILFDEEARSATIAAGDTFGKVREPVLRFTAWARAFRARDVTPLLIPELEGFGSATALAQHPYRAPSVFNFFRPGYVAPATASGAAGLVAPELQIVNATSVPSYANFMFFWVSGGPSNFEPEEAEELASFFDESDLRVTPEDVRSTLVPQYEAELAVAGDPSALVARLERLLVTGAMSDGTRALIEEAVAAFPPDGESPLGTGLSARVHAAVLLTLTSPDFLVQR